MSSRSAEITAKQALAKKKNGESNTLVIMKRVLKNRSAVVGIIILCILIFMAIFAPYLSPYRYDEINVAERLQSPSLTHPLGTDELGRDLLSRIMYGARYSLSISACSIMFSLFFGIILGMICGYFGGTIDLIIMRVLDVIGSIPGTLLAVCISAALGTGWLTTIIALGFGGITGMARMLRSTMLSTSKQEYVEAARSINCSDFRIMVKHVFPNSLSPLIVSATMRMASAIISASSLSYIGLGIQPPIPEWGAMLSAARNYIRDYPYLVMIPGIFILITVLSLNLIGDALRDALDPKLKT